MRERCEVVGTTGGNCLRLRRGALGMRERFEVVGPRIVPMTSSLCLISRAPKYLRQFPPVSRGATMTDAKPG